MARQKDHSRLLGMMAGDGGDYYIGTQAVSNKKFTHIKIGNDGATLVGVQVGGVDVKAARNYPDSMPYGYLMCAGGQDYFNHIEFSAGYGSGLLLQEGE